MRTIYSLCLRAMWGNSPWKPYFLVELDNISSALENTGNKNTWKNQTNFCTNQRNNPNKMMHQKYLSLRIHGTGIFTYIYHQNQPNVGKYTSPMDPQGIFSHIFLHHSRSPFTSPDKKTHRSCLVAPCIIAATATMPLFFPWVAVVAACITALKLRSGSSRFWLEVISRILKEFGIFTDSTCIFFSSRTGGG